jgi:8-oxo-dGTP diphosphatase
MIRSTALPDDTILIPYTLAFCFSGGDVLLVKRKRPPFAGHWNGLGGKIEDGESARQSIQRELCEEASIEQRALSRIHYSGVVAWKTNLDTAWLGMHLFGLRLRTSAVTRLQTSLSEEGTLCWISMSQITWPLTLPAVPNLPTIIPQALLRRCAPRLLLLHATGDRYSAERLPLTESTWPEGIVSPSKVWALRELSAAIQSTRATAALDGSR